MTIPAWKRWDLNYLWVLLLALPAAIPLFQSGYLDSHDGLFHLYRLQALDEAIHAGVLYPRWFPQFAFGYGQPVLNYYSPLTYYVAQLFHMLGPGYILSIKLTFAAGILLSTAFMYLYVREVAGGFPALIAAAVYTYFPYHLADTYLRAALAEAFAFVFLPLCLWAVHRLMTRGAALYLIILSLSFAGLILTHNLTALMFTPVLLAYLALMWFLTHKGRAVGPAIGSLALGGLLASFYWLPVLMETRYVGLAANIAAPGYQRHLASFVGFVSLGPVFRYLPDLGGGLEDPFYPLGLIFALLILAAVALLVYRLFRREEGGRARKERWHLFFFLLVAAASVFMMLVYSLPLWRLAQPLLASLQYPWRFMTLTALAMAMLTGLLFTLVEGQKEERRRRWLLYGLGLGLVAVLMVYALADLPTEMLPLSDGQVTMQRMWEEDFAARQIGATWTAEYVPIWVKADRSVVGLPPPDLEPFEPSDLAPGEIPQIELGRQGLLSSEMRSNAAQALTMRFHAFYFPGWAVYVDGTKVPVYPSGDLALLSADVAGGEHEVLVRFEDTPPRVAGKLLSLVTALGFVGFCVYRWRWKATVSMAILGVVLVGLVVLHMSPFNFRTQPVQEHVNLEDQVKLLGYSVERETYHPGDALQITLYWLGLQEMSQNYKVFVHFTNEALTTMWAQHDGDPVGGFTPTTRWLPGEVVADQHTLFIPVETPPGTYKLFTGMYEWETVRNLTVLTPEAASPNNRILLGEVQVVGP